MAKLGRRRRQKNQNEMTKSEYSKLAHKLWSAVVKSSGRCARCGKDWTQAQLQAAHIFPKGLYRNHPIKWLPKNGLALCSYDHRHWAHQHPTAFSDWLNEKYPGLVEELREYAKLQEYINYPAAIKQLHGLLDERSFRPRLTRKELLYLERLIYGQGVLDEGLDAEGAARTVPTAPRRRGVPKRKHHQGVPKQEETGKDGNR